jgi:hypothetical protein
MLEQDIKKLTELQQLLLNKEKELERRTLELEQQLQDKHKLSKELEQEKILLDGISESLGKKAKILEKSSKELEQKLQEKSHKGLELEMEKVLMEKMMTVEETKKKSMKKKYYVSISVAAMVLVGIIVGLAYFEAEKNAEREKMLASAVKGKFFLKTASGQPLNRGSSWNLAEGKTLYVGIMNAKNYPPEKIKVIKDAILSEETITIPNSLVHKEPSSLQSTYYKGWLGGLEKAAQNHTALYLPTKITILEDSNKGNINIELTDDIDTDGNSGTTNSVVDQDHILSASIKIFLVKDLKDDRLATIVRHEFGHALGLPHSTDPEDLMAPVTKTQYPFVSDCDINSMISLYDNKEISEVTCKK